MLNLNDQSYPAASKKAEKPMLLYFRADFCGPSAAVDPLVIQLNEDYKDAVEIGVIDVEESPSITRQMSVKGTPTFIIVNLGTTLASRIGTVTYDDLADWIEDYCKLT